MIIFIAIAFLKLLGELILDSWNRETKKWCNWGTLYLTRDSKGVAQLGLASPEFSKDFCDGSSLYATTKEFVKFFAASSQLLETINVIYRQIVKYHTIIL